MVKKKIETEAIWIDKMTGGVKKTVSTIQRFRKGLRQTVSETEKFGKAGRQTTLMVKTIKEPIQKVTDKGRKMALNQRRLNSLMSGGAQKLLDNSTQINKLGKNFDSFGGVMAMPMDQFKKFNQEGGQFNTIGARVGNRFRLLTHGVRGFRMEMLGVMFFGMGMMRFFMGLLKPAFDLVGVFDLLSLALGILFLPIALEVLDWVIKFLGKITELTDGQKKNIGTWTLWGAAIGLFLMLVGTLALGIGSLILVFGKLFGIMAPGKTILGGIGRLFGSLKSLVAGAGAIFAVVTILLIGFWFAWKENFGRIRDWVAVIWEGVKNQFQGVIDVLTGIMNVVWGIFTGDPKKIWEGVKTIIGGVIKFIKGFVQMTLGLITTLGLSAFRAVAGMVKTGFKIGQWLADKLKEVISAAFGKGQSWIMSFFKGIQSLGNTIKNWFIDLLPDWVKKAGAKFGNFLGISREGSTQQDFLMRPGQAPVAFSPNDTIVGYKGGSPGGADNDSIVRALEAVFARMEITINAPSGYDVTARMGGI